MTIEPRVPVPKWVIRRGFACVFVEAPSETESVKLAAKRLGHMGGWKVGPDVDQEVFPATEYREHAQPGDYTRSVIVAPRLRWKHRIVHGREGWTERSAEQLRRP